jgi:hypothetical protein
MDKSMTLKELEKKLNQIKIKGFIRSHRLHNTGIGKTLEDCLGIKENNIPLPDFGVMELKSQRINTQSMITLFTKSPEGISNTEVREKFGYPDREFPKIKILHQTIKNGRRNAMGFHYKVDKKNNRLSVLKNKEILGYYDLNFLKQKAVEKIGNGLILVLAETKREGGHEHFHFKHAFILKNIDPTKFITHSKYDIRLGVYHSGRLVGQRHDHGSAFRITEKDLPLLFKTSKRII